MTLRYPKTRHLGPLGSFSAPAWWTLILPEESKRHNLKVMSFSAHPIMLPHPWTPTVGLKSQASHTIKISMTLSSLIPILSGVRSQGSLIPIFHLSDKKDQHMKFYIHFPQKMSKP